MCASAQGIKGAFPTLDASTHMTLFQVSFNNFHFKGAS